MIIYMNIGNSLEPLQTASFTWLGQCALQAMFTADWIFFFYYFFFFFYQPKLTLYNYFMLFRLGKVKMGCVSLGQLKRDRGEIGQYKFFFTKKVLPIELFTWAINDFLYKYTLYLHYFTPNMVKFFQAAGGSAPRTPPRPYIFR